MSLTTIVAPTAHVPSPFAEATVDKGAVRRASARARWTSDSSVPSGRGWSRDARSNSSPTLVTFSAIVTSSRSNAASVKQAIADCCGAATERSAATAASNRVAPFCCVLMLADRSTSTRTPVLTERSMTAAAGKCGRARSRSSSTDSCKKKSGVGRGVLQAIRLVDPRTGSSWKKMAADRTARRKFGLAM
jgi:hypothetical protein